MTPPEKETEAPAATAPAAVVPEEALYPPSPPRVKNTTSTENTGNSSNSNNKNNATSAAASLQLSTFEDDGTFALPPGESFATKPPQEEQKQEQSASASGHLVGQGPGAQILMNRFSHWRQKANENATVLWQQAKEVQEKAAATNQGPLAVLRQAAAGVAPNNNNNNNNAHGNNSSSSQQKMKNRSLADEESNSRGSSVGSSEEEEEESEGSYDDDQDGVPPASTRSLPNLPTRDEMRSRVSNLASVARKTAENNAGGFIGRYANAATTIPETPPRTMTGQDGRPLSPHSVAKESQTSLILKSRAAGHLQEMLNSLEPYQYVLLLGAGRLAVNLKDPYDSKHQGTYVDFLVRGGAADRSGVVAVGDQVVKVGSQNVTKQTILEVPNTIAQAKRPVVLVMTTGVELDVDRINYVDVAVAMMHQIRAEDEMQKQAMIASAQKKTPTSPSATVSPNAATAADSGGGGGGNGEEGGESAKDIQELPENSQDKETCDQASAVVSDENAPTSPLKQPPTGGPKEEIPEDNAIPTFEKVRIPILRSVEDYTNPPLPPMEARRAYKHLVGKRCNDNFNVTQFSQVAASHDNFRAALRNAFLTCCVDGRRFPYLGRHLTMEQELNDSTNNSNPGSPMKVSSTGSSKDNANALLMLFLELLHFSDLHGVTPASARRQNAQRIANKYFLPAKLQLKSGSTTLEPPMFDFHHIVPDSVLRQLESTLNDAEAEISHDLFAEFQHAAVNALCGETFLLFLVSNHCARMRAYLRNVAPFVNIPLKPVFDALVASPHGKEQVTTIHAGAKNYFLFVLIYLMQLEKDPAAVLSTDDSTLLGRNGRRMVGAAGGLCCYLYIGRHVIPALQAFQEERKQQSDKPEILTSGGQALVEVIGQLWQLHVSPGVGALEHTWKSKETKECLESLRSILRAVRKTVLSSLSGHEGEKRTLQFALGFADTTNLIQVLKELSSLLVYDYAINSHSKFREDQFHELMCNELIKAKKDRVKHEDTVAKKDSVSALPDLPYGCIKRLLRKVDLPVGVSPHKPMHSSSDDDGVKVKDTPASYPNADCAVVFGSSVGADLSVKMMSPAMDESDIRRYTCQDITIEGGLKLPESFEEEMIPPTLESYAVLPPTRTTGFSEITGNVSISSDGWEVTMVNFMIPKADDGSSEEKDRSLYGVSLVFQRSSTARFHPRRVSQTQLVSETREEKKTELDSDNSAAPPMIDEDGKFPSPLTFETTADDHWQTFNRSINSTEETPIFNEHLREKAWIDRVLQDESRDQDVPATVGVALVSRRNVVIAMRQTLWMLLRDFSRMPEDKDSSERPRKHVITCGSLVDLLGNFAHQDVEGKALRCILEPYIRAASSPWIERPLSAQREEFERLAGQQLITCLPPIPLALLFVAAVLEQKIVLSSSRRSILFSATEALKGLLKPLGWCHLLVPLVPSALAKDLVHYPAPFILGMPSEDPGVVEIMNNLPMDVTLVDLDVGRVILCPEFSFDSTGFSVPADQSPAQTMTELRSQVLYLAQILGSHFGAKLFRDAWSCDSPSMTLQKAIRKDEADYDILRNVCRNFIDELLSGVSSSCFWVEEEADSSRKCHAPEPTVLFDEDRFFHIKRWREEQGYEPLLEESDAHMHRSLALSTDGFNLVLETFVRCQSMNRFLSSQPKAKMVCSL